MRGRRRGLVFFLAVTKAIALPKHPGASVLEPPAFPMPDPNSLPMV